MMGERLIKLLLIGVILSLACTAGVFADTKGINLIINGQKLEGAGVMVDGQVMVPIETLARSMGGTFEWAPESETASVTLPVPDPKTGIDLTDDYAIKVNKITEGITILTVSGEVINTGNRRLTTLTVYGKLLNTDNQELTRTYSTNLEPTELAPGETGTFEVIFMDYDKFKENNARYGIYVQGFPL
ncbi:FxLYD domain-containing protein [Pelotomaculum isophthalicicum JI]|uniref:FxLYD domain-containing protein n=1 Tax=Pelotomaculum isophthalicicum JI TaxID=947010 RepID=A0A9X4GZS2_9FIRM|nr:FxLYD domain-containing protein [Pelotomaculum isophthalicicum]MDF9409112.1 FxLYD domain-containing protein [Pelotomaculum isophthalicicum JI]